MTRSLARKGRKRQRATASRPDLPGPRRRDPRAMPAATLTIDTLRNNRGQLVGTSDLIVLGVVSSYMGLRRLMKDGLFPSAKRLPSGFLCWEGGQIVDWYDALPSSGPAVPLPKAARRADNPLDE